MKVVFVSEHCCSRVWKEGVALTKAGIEVVFVQKRIANPNFESMLPSLVYYTNPDQLVDKLYNMRDIDLIHVHNEPDWFGHICKQARPDLPVVFDAHDLFSVRIGKSVPDETKSFQMCDAFVYPSRYYMEHSIELHRVGDKPNLLLYSMPNSDFIVHNPLPRMDSLCYEGGIRIKEGDEVPEEHKYHAYRDYREVFKWLTNQGIPLMVFSANPDVLEQYMPTGAFMLPPMEYTALLRNLSRFSWGLAGGPIKHKQWDTAMPHKLFEYLISGIPVITFNAQEVKEFVEEHGIGLALESYEQIPEVYNRHEEFRKVVHEKRNQFVMENHIGKLIKLYMELT